MCLKSFHVHWQNILQAIEQQNQDHSFSTTQPSSRSMLSKQVIWYNGLAEILANMSSKSFHLCWCSILQAIEQQNRDLSFPQLSHPVNQRYRKR
ncbi:hypothetical protein AVEN_232101-1 [Araneus ventricosus]|uniref:Uncharacterized protein n=1 Tax=Araneus ventricosus TaxID=182803 RepID=A0A4Y1ZMT3_ARAVE|nr:hypothetical protein AVEN_232101-1 [Araneus ventricosus]